jgi:hypothetical protein
VPSTHEIGEHVFLLRHAVSRSARGAAEWLTVIETSPISKVPTPAELAAAAHDVLVAAVATDR